MAMLIGIVVGIFMTAMTILPQKVKQKQEVRGKTGSNSYTGIIKRRIRKRTNDKTTRKDNNGTKKAEKENKIKNQSINQTTQTTKG